MHAPLRKFAHTALCTAARTAFSRWSTETDAGCFTTIGAKQTCLAVARIVAEDFGFGAAAILGRARGTPAIARARQIAMYIVHVEFELSHQSVGRGFGRDRTTVAHACRVVEELRDETTFDSRIAVLEKSCRSALRQVVA
jgi:chromosomal replication initiation ATPase DnaA